MKKLLTLAVIAAIFGFTACGPSEEDAAKAEEAANEMIENLSNAADEATATEEAVTEESTEDVVEDTTAVEEVEEASAE